MPLITTASGTKFGKTEAGAVWLDAKLTSPFRFYQFWLNTDDSDAAKYLRYFTFLDRPRSSSSKRRRGPPPNRREAQRVLAREVTRMVHGDEHVSRAERASSVLVRRRHLTLPADDVLSVFDDVPSSTVRRRSWQGRAWRLSSCSRRAD
jgi:tyrosyl-tRNA synthetase